MKIPQVKITADRDVCIGAGMCVMTAPEMFDQDDEGIVVLLEADVPAEQADAAVRAVANCPSGALRRIDG
jgi:ferredoxin